MSDTHRCPHCGDPVDREAVDIDGIASRRSKCSGCDRTLVGTPCPECGPAGGSDGADDGCPTCGGDGVVLRTLDDLLS